MSIYIIPFSFSFPIHFKLQSSRHNFGAHSASGGRGRDRSQTESCCWDLFHAPPPPPPHGSPLSLSLLALPPGSSLSLSPGLPHLLLPVPFLSSLITFRSYLAEQPSPSPFPYSSLPRTSLWVSHFLYLFAMFLLPISSLSRMAEMLPLAQVKEMIIWVLKLGLAFMWKCCGANT